MTREGRRLSLYLGLTTAVTGFLQPFVPLYLDASGLDKATIGFVAGAGAAMAIVIQPLLGRLSDHFDARRPFVVLTALLAAFAYLAFPYLHGPVAFLLAVALGANALMYMQGVGGVLVGRLAATGEGGATYASYRIWGSIGYVFVSLATGLLLNRPGGLPPGRTPLDPVFQVGPLLFFVVAALAYWLPDPRRPASTEPLGKACIAPNLRRFLAADFLYVVALYGATTFLALFVRSVGGSGLWITRTFVAGVIAEVLVMRRSGTWSDRAGRRPLLALSYLLLPIRLLLYAPATGPAWVFAVQSLHGLNYGIVGAVSIAFVNDQADHRTRGALQARLSMITALAAAAGPALLGAVANRYGLPTMFVVAAGIAVVAALVFLLFVDESNPHARGTGIGWLDRRILPERGGRESRGTL